jgi:hypothetical protein
MMVLLSAFSSMLEILALYEKRTIVEKRFSYKARISSMLEKALRRTIMNKRAPREKNEDVSHLVDDHGHAVQDNKLAAHQSRAILHAKSTKGTWPISTRASRIMDEGARAWSIDFVREAKKRKNIDMPINAWLGVVAAVAEPGLVWI